MATDEDHRRYTMDDPHPADEDLPPKLMEFIYGEPDEMPELEWPDEDETDPFIHGGRVGVDDEA